RGGVEDGLEPALVLLQRPAGRDKSGNVPADRRKQRQHLRVPWALLAGEELEHSSYLPASCSGERDCGAQAAFPRGTGAGECGVRRQVVDPLEVAAGPGAAGKALAVTEAPLAARLLELGAGC